MDFNLMHNIVFKSDARSASVLEPGLYRVVIDLPELDATVLANIESTEERPPGRGGRKRKEGAKKRKKRLPPLVGMPRWVNRNALFDLKSQGLLQPFEISRDFCKTLCETGLSELKVRKDVAEVFLDLDHLKESVLVNRSLGALVREAMANCHVSKSLVYKVWSMLCRLGFEESSLSPRHDRSGPPGVPRPCDPENGRHKAGRMTKRERIIKYFTNVRPAPEQPGMSTAWKTLIVAAASMIKPPKPSMRKQVDQIAKSAFVNEAKEVDGKVVYVEPQIGTYPNRSQIRRVLKEWKSQLDRVREQTTQHHFDTSLRGLTGRNWEGVAGPGHTWAIDSTVGDIYLRSSVNRAWIIGRPIVYVIVDVWSTAVVGFHVCLTGPSWATARVSLFNSVASVDLMQELWGGEWLTSLSPHPTFCFALMCDRGEYLSKAHRCTAKLFIRLTSYASPYRPDLKGLVEVLHRIEKDEQFLFIPGAFDFRRRDMEKEGKPAASARFTLNEYVHYLHELFRTYNLTADRRHRMDARMIAAGVPPVPSGLWSWGHAVGIGYQRYFSEADLITQLLPESIATIGRSSVKFARCDYTSDVVKQEQWTAVARNFGNAKIPNYYYPGSMSRIWTPNTSEGGLLKLDLMDESRVSPETPFDDWLDALAIQTMGRPGEEHSRLLQVAGSLRRQQDLLERADRLTREALEKAASTSAPTMTQARLMELAAQAAGDKPLTERQIASKLKDELFESYFADMNQCLQETSRPE